MTKTISVRFPDDVAAALEGVDGGKSAFIVGAVRLALGHEVSVKAPVSAVKPSSAQPVEKRAASSAKGDAASGRSEFCREVGRLVAAAQDDGFRRPDDRLLWDELRKGCGTERQLRDRLGWMDMRVSKAVASLMASGRAVVGSAGVLEAV